MLLRILSILFPVFFVAALGYLVGKRIKPDLTHTNRLNLDVFVPAMVFAAMASKDFQVGNYLPLLGGTAIQIGLMGVAAWGVARALGLQPKTLALPMMFNNCGNLGLPLAVLAFGREALPVAVAMFVVCNVLQFSVGTWLLDHKARLTTVWMSPSILAAIAGLLVGVSGITVWEPLLQALRMVGDMSVPLMLFALGVRMAESRISAVGFGVFGAALRPVCGMAIGWVIAVLMGLPERDQAMLILFGALPPAVVNFIFAERYDQEPEKVAAMVLIGNMAAVISLPVALALVLR